MLLLTLVMLVAIEAMYILYLKVPEWISEDEQPYERFIISLACREGAVGGLALLGLFWAMYILGLLVS